MQKVKRKFNEDDASSPKKKKVSSNNAEGKPALGESSKNNKLKKDFKKIGANGPNKFGKPKFNKDGKGKPGFGKDQSKFGKGKPNFGKDGKGKPNFAKDGKGKPNFGKDGKEKPNFSKDQANGEKPKWSEMKKEKKELRLVRRKAKATAEVFEVSHKAKLLAAQIQR